MKLPTFQYHPDPISTGVIIPSENTCCCCGRMNGFIYIGPVYAIDEYNECICPWCISNGSAHNNLDASFSDEAAIGGYGRWDSVTDNIIEKIGRVPDNYIEIYCKSADIMLLPYKHIFQSAVLFLSYSFGLPAIATDVGSLKEDVIQGKTGFICKPEDPDDLAEKIDLYFQSNLFRNLNENRKVIMKYANEKYSWEEVGEKTLSVYNKLLYK